MTIARAETLAAKLGSGRILLGGHRGNPAEYPENTLASFRSAIELGVDVIECDVHRSEDGRLPVIHDHLLDRTTNGSGLVRDHTMAELKRFEAGPWKDARFTDERIPSLDEARALAKGNVGVAIEIKNLPLPYPGIEELVVDAIRSAEMMGGVVVISFDHRSIMWISCCRSWVNTVARLIISRITGCSTLMPLAPITARAARAICDASRTLFILAIELCGAVALP